MEIRAISPQPKDAPHSVEAEQQLLGAILTNNENYDRISGIVSAANFYDPVHSRIFETAAGRIEAGSLASPVTLKVAMSSDDGLNSLGGPRYLARLAGAAVCSFAIRDYAVMIADLSAKRDMLAQMDDTRSEIEDGKKSAAEIAGKLEATVGAVASRASVKPLIRSHMSSVIGAVEQISEAYQGIAPAGIPTGLPQLDEQLGFLRPGNMIVLAGRPAMGKAQPIDEPVLTTSGWVRMGDLKIGTNLASVDGAPSQVVGIYPQGRKQAFKVTLSDGRWARCCGEHLWAIDSSRLKGRKVVSTDELGRIIRNDRFKGRVTLPTVSGDFFEGSGLEVAPWLLGLLLGDGCLSQGSIRFSTPDPEVIKMVTDHLMPDLTVKHVAAYDYSITGTVHGKNALLSAMRSFGLVGKLAHEKFVPEPYMLASREDRLALLRGLMDADGWVEKFGAIRFLSTSQRLSEDVVELVRSLGGMARISTRESYLYEAGDRKRCRDGHPVNIQMPEGVSPFTLDRKGERIRRRYPAKLRVVSVEPDGIEEQQCIAVSHPSHLYVTRDFIVTHNTTAAQNIAYHAAKNGTGVFFGSLEMLGEELASRFLSKGLAESGHSIPYSRMIKGRLSEAEMRAVVAEAKRQEALPLKIGERDVREVRRFRSAVKRARQEMADTACPLGLVIVDYVQKMAVDGSRGAYEAASAASDMCKDLAMDLGIPVIALAQLSRAVEQRDPCIPMLSDLRETGKLEEDADVVIFCYRDAYYLQRKLDAVPSDDIETRNDLSYALSQSANNLDLIVGKQRSGPTGTVKAFINPGLCHVYAEKIQDGGHR